MIETGKFVIRKTSNGRFLEYVLMLLPNPDFPGAQQTYTNYDNEADIFGAYYDEYDIVVTPKKDSS